MASPSETVLITGARGFTGQYLTRLLSQLNYNVYGLVHGQAQENNEISCDITSRAAVHKVLQTVRPDYIVHLAAISFVPYGNVAEVYQINLFGTLNLLDSVLEVGLQPRKIVIASSANVYGSPAVETIDETACPAPINHYANSKLAMEHMVRTYFDRLRIIITRPFNYTGVGQAEHFLIPKIVKHYQGKRPYIELGNLDIVRDFSAAQFVAAVYQKLMASEHHSTIVNICSGQGIALTQVIALLNEIAGYEIQVRVNPELVRSNEIKRLVGSNRKLFELVGRQPIYSIRDILLGMYNSLSPAS